MSHCLGPRIKEAFLAGPWDHPRSSPVWCFGAERIEFKFLWNAFPRNPREVLYSGGRRYNSSLSFYLGLSVDLVKDPLTLYEQYCTMSEDKSFVIAGSLTFGLETIGVGVVPHEEQHRKHLSRR